MTAAPSGSPPRATAAPSAPASGLDHPGRAQRRTALLWLASLVGAAVLLWLASQRVDLWPAQLVLPRPDLLALAAGLHLPYSAARSLRLRYALDSRVRIATGDRAARVPRDLVYGSGLVSFFVILLLPLRLGELSRPLILARAGVPGIGLPEAIAAVASERAVDVARGRAFGVFVGVRSDRGHSHREHRRTAADEPRPRRHDLGHDRRTDRLLHARDVVRSRRR